MRKKASLLREKAAQVPPAQKRLFDLTGEIAAGLAEVLKARGMTSAS